MLEVLFNVTMSQKDSPFLNYVYIKGALYVKILLHYVLLGFQSNAHSKHSVKSLPLAFNICFNVCNILYKIMFNIPARHFTSARVGTCFRSGRHWVSTSESTR